VLPRCRDAAKPFFQLGIVRSFLLLSQTSQCFSHLPLIPSPNIFGSFPEAHGQKRGRRRNIPLSQVSLFALTLTLAYSAA
jgi:hypothetical protein